MLHRRQFLIRLPAGLAVDCGKEVVRAQLKECDHVGEQSLLPGRSGRRNASLRAREDVTLLRIPRTEFQQILSQRHTLKDLLSQTGEQQLRQQLMRTSMLARRWALFMFVNGFVSIAILCALAMVFHTPFIFPSLGAMAFLMFFMPTAPAASPRNAVCGTAIALVCGYGALWLTGLQHAGPAIVGAQLRRAREALRAWRGAAARATLRGQIAGLANLPHGGRGHALDSLPGE